MLDPLSAGLAVNPPAFTPAADPRENIESVYLVLASPQAVGLPHCKMSAFPPTFTVWLNGYKFGLELLIVNGSITFLGLFIISKKNVT